MVEILKSSQKQRGTTPPLYLNSIVKPLGGYGVSFADNKNTYTSDILNTQSTQVHDRTFCDQLESPGHLLLAVSLDLATMQNIGTDLQILDRSEAALQLVLELTDGCFLIWPSLLKVSSSHDLSDTAEKKDFGTPEQVLLNKD